ncbi:uncharacterized protein LOC135367134 [Ornithodoros turicata]|uniref:uncharacterized protein LOC135367134 n=1 Tax=Ornithodoros turicata TaxID=34597 RepID=UPI003139F444
MEVTFAVTKGYTTIGFLPRYLIEKLPRGFTTTLYSDDDANEWGDTVPHDSLRLLYKYVPARNIQYTGLHNCLQTGSLKMLNHAILLLGLFAVSSTAYVATGSPAEEGNVNAGVNSVESIGAKAQRVGIVLQDVAKHLRVAVKTMDKELLTDHDDTEYFLREILGNVANIVGGAADAVMSTAGSVVSNILEKVGLYALDERSITAQDVLTRLCDDIEDAGNTIFQSGVLLYGGELPKEQN